MAGSKNSGTSLRQLLDVTGHDADYEFTDTNELVGLQFRAIIGIESQVGHPDKNIVASHLRYL